MTSTTITFQGQTFATSGHLMNRIVWMCAVASDMDKGAERDALIAKIDEAKALHATVAAPRVAVEGCHWCGLPLNRRGICTECGEQF